MQDSLKIVSERVTAIAILLAGFGLTPVVWWASDVLQDRRHTISANSLTPIFGGSGGEQCDDAQKLTTVQPGASVRVRRIRYWKNCATLDVTLQSGQKGYIVLGVGDVTVHPPLN